MIADEQVTTEPSSLFSAQDQAAIRAQLKKRLILVLIPVLVLQEWLEKTKTNSV